MTAWEKNEKKNAALEVSYRFMIDEVNRWNPPTRDHVEMKKFMLQQLKDSLRLDCGGYEKPTCLSGATYKTQQIRLHTHDVEYHIEEGEKERERAAERTQWVRDLRESLAKWTT